MRLVRDVKAFLVAAALAGVVVAVPAEAAFYGRSGTGGTSIPAGTRLTASADQANLDFSGLSGAADGGYECEGTWQAGTGGDNNLILQINSVTSGYTTAIIYATGAAGSNALGNSAGDPGGGSVTNGVFVGRAGGASGRSQMKFRCRVMPSSASYDYFVQCESHAYASTSQTAFEVFHSTSTVANSGAISDLKYTTSSGSSTGIKSTSTGTCRKLGWTS